MKTSLETLSDYLFVCDNHHYIEVVIFDDDGLFSTHYFFSFKKFEAFVNKIAKIKDTLSLKVYAYINSRNISDKVVNTIHDCSSWLKEDKVDVQNILTAHNDLEDGYYYVIEVHNSFFIPKYIDILKSIDENITYTTIHSDLEHTSYLITSFFDIGKFHQERIMRGLKASKIYKDGYIPVFLE